MSGGLYYDESMEQRGFAVAIQYPFQLRVDRAQRRWNHAQIEDPGRKALHHHEVPIIPVSRDQDTLLGVGRPEKGGVGGSGHFQLCGGYHVVPQLTQQSHRRRIHALVRKES